MIIRAAHRLLSSALLLALSTALWSTSSAQELAPDDIAGEVVVPGTRPADIDYGSLPDFGIDGSGPGYDQSLGTVQVDGRDARATGCNEGGNPIVFATGNKIERETDFVSAGEMPLSLHRTYNYHFTDRLGLFGAHWLSNFDYSVAYANGAQQLCEPGSSMECELSGPYTAFLYRPDGRRIAFSIAGLTPDFMTSYQEVDYRISPTGQVHETFFDVKATGNGFLVRNEEGGTERYDLYGQIKEIKDRHGVTWTFSYDAPTHGKLQRVTHSSGRYIQFNWVNGRIQSVIDPAGTAYQYAYGQPAAPASSLYLLTSITQPGPPNTTITYHYGTTALTSGQLLGKSYNGVRYSTFTYDGTRRALSSEHAGGVERFSYIYLVNPSGELLQAIETNSLGKRTTYAFTAGKLASVTGEPSTHCAARFRSTSYDTGGHPDHVNDFNGNTTDYNYDWVGHLLSKTEAYGTTQARTTTYVWDVPNKRLTSETVTGLRRVSYGYHPDGRLSSVAIQNQSPFGPALQTRTTTYAYTKHPNGLVATMVVDGPASGSGDAITSTYSAQGNLLTVSNGLAHTTTYSNYNALGLPGRIVGPNGETTDITYDLRGRTTNVCSTGISVCTQYVYNAAGLLESTTSHEGSTVYTYDDARRVMSFQETEPGGIGKIEYTRNDASDVTTERIWLGPWNSIVSYTDYDELSRPRAERGYHGQNVRYEYDANDNLVKVIDSLNRETVFAYDALSRRVASVNAIESLNFEYDRGNFRTLLTDPRGNTSIARHDGFGLLARDSNPDGGLVTYTYDSGGRLQTRVDGRSKTAIYSYEMLGRVHAIGLPDQTITYGYDSGTYGRGHLTSLSNGVSALAWAFNSAGRLQTRQQSVGSFTKSASYTYVQDRVQQLTMPSGRVIEYGYTNGRPTSVKVDGSPLLSNVLYLPFGPTQGWQWANGTFAIRQHDTSGRLTMIDSADLNTQTYSVDDRISSGEVDAPFTLALGSVQHSIDPGSNRILSSTGALPRTYSYDGSGNVLSDGARSFTYDDVGRMVTATAGGTTATYAYNALGQRVRKIVGGQTRYYFYDDAGRLLSEFDQSGAWIQDVVWLEDLPVAVLRPSGSSHVVYYIHVNHLGTPNRISRPSDNVVVWRWDTDPFGVSAANENPDGDATTFSFNLRFPGQYYDAETGLHYNWQRYYDPKIGRYLQSDPLGVLAGTNTYAYVQHDPMHRIDPTGELDSLPQDFVDFFAGAGDELLGGAGPWLREQLGIDGGVDECSAAYGYGDTVAGVASSLTPSGAARRGAILAARGAAARGLWKITKEGTAATVRHARFGTFHKSRSDGLWWSKDKAAHGGSEWKVFEATADGLKWRADADKYGDFITGKHKSDIGTLIPWGELAGVR